MDKSIMSAEGSSVQINSIAIDLDCTMGETTQTQSLTHEHFSIRGFTAEMRKKDRKACLPFASESGDDMNLPPLPVPKFRYWKCSDCLVDILDLESGAGLSSVHTTVEEKDGLQLVESIVVPDVGNSEGGDSFPGVTKEANQVQTKQITCDNSADENQSTGPHNPGKTSSLSDGDVPFSSVPPKRKPKLRSLADIIKEGEQQIEPELDPQAPRKGATKTFHRRKKIVLEDEEEEETDHPIATADRSKGPVIESNNDNTTSRSIEISESELLFDSQMSAKTDVSKDQKQRFLDINRNKDPPVAVRTSTGDTGLFLLGEQVQQGISDVWKGKRVEEGGYIPYTNDDSLGVCNNNEEVALDLSLSSYSEKQECSGRHMEIPDLNESFVEQPEETLHENSDTGKASDDIPMEIVELLAKNQQERSLANSTKHHTFNFSGGGTMGFLNFPGSKNCDSNWGQFRQFGPPTPDQQRTELHSGPTNVPRPDLLWPPRRKNMTAFDISQPSSKGKNVKRAVTDWSLESRSVDVYSNDTIPAMQLLSLMDQRNVSAGSSFKQFSPCSHHPKDQFASSSSSFFGQRQSNGTNDFPTLLSGARCSDGFSSKNILSLGQVPTQKGNSRPVELAGPSNLLARAWRSNPVSEVCCTLNRNPADFSAPDARNEFMISAKDLKRRKRKRRVGNDLSRRGNN